ncbi:MAG: DUF4132 domain-containing protein, partial [Nocardioides sp.]
MIPEPSVADRASRLVSRLEDELMTGRTPVDLPADLRQLPEAQDVLNTTGATRLACVREVIRRREGVLGSSDLLAMLANWGLDPETDDIVDVLNPLQQAATPAAERVVTAMRRHIEDRYRYGGPDRGRLEPLLLGAAAHHSDLSVAAGLYTLVGEDAQADELHARIQAAEEERAAAEDRRTLQLFRTVFEVASEPADFGVELRSLLASRGPATRLPKTWRAEAERLWGGFARPGVVVGALLDAAESDLDTFAEWLRGVVTLAGMFGDAQAPPKLRRLAVKGFEQDWAGQGLSIANAGVAAIARIGGLAAITELLALERSMRHGTVLNAVRRAIERLAADRGLTRDELLELAVEDHGLDRGGRRVVPLSRGHAEVVTDGRTVVVAYVDDKGVRRKGFPAAVKAADAEALAGLRREAKAVRTTVAGERARFDGLLLADRGWEYGEWRARYLDHPVTGRLARSVIWRFRDSGAPADAPGGEIVGIPVDQDRVMTVSGLAVALTPDAEVRLWHPVAATPEVVGSWREYLLGREVAQPVKQAFRELYVPTPAE